MKERREEHIGVNVYEGDVLLRLPDSISRGGKVGDILFTPAQARALAYNLHHKAAEAEGGTAPRSLAKPIITVTESATKQWTACIKDFPKHSHSGDTALAALAGFIANFPDLFNVTVSYHHYRP